jgi:hypothetical protein
VVAKEQLADLCIDRMQGALAEAVSGSAGTMDPVYRRPQGCAARRALLGRLAMVRQRKATHTHMELLP